MIVPGALALAAPNHLTRGLFLKLALALVLRQAARCAYLARQHHEAHE